MTERPPAAQEAGAVWIGQNPGIGKTRGGFHNPNCILDAPERIIPNEQSVRYHRYGSANPGVPGPGPERWDSVGGGP
jgi:hypothetical protein